MSGARAIYLVGMMGVGKSTIGPLLAQELACVFVDTDAEVERTAGGTIAELFETEGEARFRELEAEAIERASAEPAVIALGGGAIAQPGMLERLRASGEIVYLRASCEVLMGRIGDVSSRPLLAGLDRAESVARLEDLLESRRQYYEQADYVIDAEGSAAAVVGRILEALGDLPRRDGQGGTRAAGR